MKKAIVFGMALCMGIATASMAQSSSTGTTNTSQGGSSNSGSMSSRSTGAKSSQGKPMSSTKAIKSRTRPGRMTNNDNVIKDGTIPGTGAKEKEGPRKKAPGNNSVPRVGNK